MCQPYQENVHSILAGNKAHTFIAAFTEILSTVPDRMMTLKHVRVARLQWAATKLKKGSGS